MRVGLLRGALALGWGLRPSRPVVPEIDAYLGYATPDHLVARGRLLARLRRPRARDGQGRLRNALQMASLFLTDEMADRPVRTDGAGRSLEALSDEEGYFTLLVPRRPQDPSRGPWAEVAVEAGGRPVTLPVQVPHPQARLGVIADIDDTVIRTGAWTLRRNLWTTFTGNLATREVFPDAVALLDRLSEGGRNPVFFVSSSPWNLHAFLEGLLAQAGCVRAPLFLRDLGLGQVSSLGGGHGSHKGSVIDRLLAANPGLPFWLVGDTGQKDARVYADASGRHPGRVARVVLRRAGREAEPGAVARLRSQGIPVDLLPDYGPLLARWPDPA